MFKKLSKIILVIVILCGMATSVSAQDDRYVWLYSTDLVTCYIDTKTITKSSDYHTSYIDVWTKEISNEAGKAVLTEWVRKSNRSIAGYDNFDHRMSERRFSLSSNECLNVRSVDYDTEGMVLNDIVVSQPWKSIVPGTANEVTANFVKNYYK